MALRIQGARIKNKNEDSTFLDFSNTNYVVGSTLHLTGDLVVNGTNTILNTEEVVVEDRHLTLANGSSLGTLVAGVNLAGVQFGTHTNIGNLTVGSDEFRFTNATGSIVDLFALNNDVENEISDRTSDVASLDTAVSNEVSDRTSDVASLDTAVSNEVSDRTSDVASLDTAVSNEVSDRTSDVGSLDTAVSNEVSDRTSDVLSLDTAVSNEASERTSDVASLDTAVSNEASERTSDVTSLAASIGNTQIDPNNFEGLIPNTTNSAGTQIGFGRNVQIGLIPNTTTPLTEGSNLTVNVGNGSSAAEFSVTDNNFAPLFVVQRNTDGNEGSVISGIVNATTFADENDADNVYLRYTAGNLTVKENAGYGGYVTASVFDTASDENLKTNIENLTGALNAVLNLRGVTYNWKNGAPRQEVGVIAQDIQRHFPQIVHTHDNHLTVDYSRLTAVLIEAVKELDSRVKALEARA